ncbi:hypothetical protein HIM_04616 [Hirsutella minnesotensis 3608]|uniref:Uncharacterized protein n=1 Tax=Hirsutella minnesotensis 3608 TaxID=1043627 RepID=A0A0F7ZPV5_9HYPO|nr:hypothetical protein HIM_04616 [Hirsutella minnesotensis 3608]
MDHLSIGRLTTHRPSKSADYIPRISPLAKDDVFRPDSAPKKPARYSLSWLTPARRRPHSPPAVVRSDQHLHRISNPLPPVLATPHLSADLSATSQNNAPALVTSQQHPEPEPQVTKPASSPPLRRRRGSPALRGKFGRQLHWYDQGLFGDLLLKMSDLHGQAGDPAAQARQAKDDQDLSSNVQQLMQEAERAFESVGNAINKVPLTSWFTESPGSASAPKPVESTSAPATAPTMPSPRQEQSKKSPVFERRQPVRKASVTKSPRKRIGRKTGQEVPAGVRSQARAIPWSLAESFGNALGQRFKRVEVDEMLTPDRMEELKRSREEAREAEERSRSSTESKRSTSTEQTSKSDTLFSMEDVASTTEAENYAPEGHGPYSPEDQLQTCPEPMIDDCSSATEDDEPHMTSPVTIGSFTFPAPPTKAAMRHVSRPPQSARLSTIPEGQASLRSSQSKPKRDSRSLTPHWRVEANEDVVFLKGAPLSCANRAFRHGPIPCQKPAVVRFGRGTEELDESVDWLAFQMAILGGAGDLVSGMYEDDQNQLADDVVEWFETFGFESHGQLIAANGNQPQDYSCGSLSTSPPTVNTDTELPIPVNSEATLAHSRGAHGESADRNTVKFYRKTGSPELRRYRAANGQVRRPSLAYDRTVPVASEPRVTEAAPMGCNLERDLGDFLRWESQFVNGVY